MKCPGDGCIVLFAEVAPHTGAWIEIVGADGRRQAAVVAPHTGAWIEIPICCTLCAKCKSRPTRARGLKFTRSDIAMQALPVAPHAGAWIEIEIAPTA